MRRVRPGAAASRDGGTSRSVGATRAVGEERALTSVAAGDTYDGDTYDGDTYDGRSRSGGGLLSSHLPKPFGPG